VFTFHINCKIAYYSFFETNEEHLILLEKPGHHPISKIVKESVGQCQGIYEYIQNEYQGDFCLFLKYLENRNSTLLLLVDNYVLNLLLTFSLYSSVNKRTPSNLFKIYELYKENYINKSFHYSNYKKDLISHFDEPFSLVNEKKFEVFLLDHISFYNQFSYPQFLNLEIEFINHFYYKKRLNNLLKNYLDDFLVQTWISELNEVKKIMVKRLDLIEDGQFIDNIENDKNGQYPWFLDPLFSSYNYNKITQTYSVEFLKDIYQKYLILKDKDYIKSFLIPLKHIYPLNSKNIILDFLDKSFISPYFAQCLEMSFQSFAIRYCEKRESSVQFKDINLTKKMDDK